MENSDAFYVPKEGDKISAVDYSDENNWLSLPMRRSKAADVFFICPTSWKALPGQNPICSIDYLPMRTGSKHYFASQASAFATVGDIFFPYYRQLDAAFALAKTFSEQQQYVRGIPKTDIFAAFDYYIKNHNNGRPFIVAAHSQGSALLRELLIDYFNDNPEINQKLIAAYVIGFSITKQDLELNHHLKFAEGAYDTGVIVSYNTEAPNVIGKNSTLMPDTLVINPISWSRSEELAPASHNLGSYVDNEKIMGLADAKIDLQRGSVVCSTVDIAKYSYPESFRSIFPLGVYHRYDYAFYYYNLRKNAEERTRKFLGK